MEIQNHTWWFNNLCMHLSLIGPCRSQ